VISFFVSYAKEFITAEVCCCTLSAVKWRPLWFSHRV
jgi:hypothetical protein